MIYQSELRSRIVYEDNHLIAINKKAGWLVQGDKTGDISLVDALKAYIKEAYEKPGEVFLGSIHRLDRPVTGLVIFARTSKALERMNFLFSSRNVVKRYVAVLEGKPAKTSGTLEHYLLKDPQNNTVRSYAVNSKYPKDAKHAQLDFELESSSSNRSVVNILPLTGRSHQIRVQMASMRTPIVGDLKYGASKALADMSIALHSRSLEFVHPVKKEKILVEAELPEVEWWGRNYKL